MKKDTLNKLLDRLDHFDSGELQNLLIHIAKQKGLFKEVFEVLQEGLILLNADGEITYANRAAGNIFQKDVKDLRRHDIDLLLGHGDTLNVILKNGIAVSHDVEVFYPEHKFLNMYIAPISTDNESHVILIRDVTGEHADKEEILEAEQLNSLTLLAAGVAHEIGNPLNSIGLHLQLLSRKLKLQAENKQTDTSEMQSLVQTALSETTRMDSILKQFLQAIRPGKPEREPMKLNPLVEEMLEVLAPELESRKIKVELNLSAEQPLVALDPTQIKQAIYNLIKNAYQSLPSEGGEIMITTEFNSHEVGLIVSDSGCGISPEIMGSIYEPFVSTKKYGSGLGLLIVRRIIKEHGGSMTIVSQLDKGTSITALLPRYDKPRNLLANTPS